MYAIRYLKSIFRTERLMIVCIISHAWSRSQLKERKQHCQSAKNKFPCNKWFDDECTIAKRCFKKSARLLQMDPENTVVYQHFWQERRAYKSLTRKKKRQATILLHNELKECKINNPREFWKLVDRATNQSKDLDNIPIPMEELGAYFKSLLDNSTDNTYCIPPVTSFVTILDEPMYCRKWNCTCSKHVKKQ